MHFKSWSKSQWLRPRSGKMKTINHHLHLSIRTALAQTEEGTRWLSHHHGRIPACTAITRARQNRTIWGRQQLRCLRTWAERLHHHVHQRVVARELLKARTNKVSWSGQWGLFKIWRMIRLGYHQNLLSSARRVITATAKVTIAYLQCLIHQLEPK